MNLTLTTNQKPILDTQKIMRKESKHKTKESYQITKEKSKRRRKKRITKQLENKFKMAKNPINTFF